MQLRSQFLHSCICEEFIYSHDCSTFFCCIAFADRSWEHMNRSKIHECRNWERGHVVSFLGIFVSNFRCSVKVYKLSATLYTTAYPLLGYISSTTKQHPIASSDASPFCHISSSTRLHLILY